MTLCFCRSGKTFFSCCLNTVVHKKTTEIKNELQRLHGSYFYFKGNNRMYTCMYPGCNKPACGSHSMSKASQLDKISFLDGKKKTEKKVLCIRNDVFKEGFTLETVGINNQRLKTPLFCSTHDHSFFDPLDTMGMGIMRTTENVDIPSQLVYCSSYRSLCMTKKILETDLEKLRSSSYRKLMIIRNLVDCKEKFNLNYMNLQQHFNSIAKETEWWIDNDIQREQDTLQGIENSIRHMNNHLFKEPRKSGSFFSTPKGTVIVFSMEDVPPVMVSSILCTGKTSSGNEYANSISNIILPNGKWAYVVFCPHENEEQSLIAKQIEERMSEVYFLHNRGKNNKLSFDILFNIMASCENVTISKQWWDTLGKETQDTLKFLMNTYNFGADSIPLVTEMVATNNLPKKNICVNYGITYGGVYNHRHSPFIHKAREMIVSWWVGLTNQKVR